VATLWAKVEGLRGREFFAAGQMQAATDVPQAIKALESQNNSDFPWMPVLLVTGAALVIGFATGAVVAHELAKPKNSS
jgi:hypothetical protein